MVQRISTSFSARYWEEDCFNQTGKRIDCADSQQDGALQRGSALPQKRFSISHDRIRDNLTGLDRTPTGNSTETHEKEHPWRLPNINELTSLIAAAILR